MDMDLARHVIRVAFRSSRELEDLMQLLKAHGDREEYDVFAMDIAAAIDRINTALLDKIFSSHPELRNEVETSIAKYDCYL